MPVRFDTDQFSVVMNEADLISIRSAPIKEVIGEVNERLFAARHYQCGGRFPGRLCKITRRTDGVILRIAESDEPVTLDGETYQVIPGIHVSAVTHSNNGEMPSCQIVCDA